MRQIGLRWPDDLIAQVDQARGEVSRSEFIRACVARCLVGVPSKPGHPKPMDTAGCPHPKPWKQLSYGTFCVACGKKIR